VVDHDTLPDGPGEQNAAHQLAPSVGDALAEVAVVASTEQRTLQANSDPPVCGESVPPGEPSAKPGTFEVFFRAGYRPLLKQARYAGASMPDAEDAVAATMADVYTHWDRLDDPLAWGRCAVVRHFVKAKTRRQDRARAEQARPDAGITHGRVDANLSAREDWQWIKQLLLDLLTPEQREVMALVLDGYTPTEIAEELRVTPEAVRQRLSQARKPLKQAWHQQLVEMDDDDRGEPS
jgi:RNA polymerase sigma factor (sigma-70 family)